MSTTPDDEEHKLLDTAVDINERAILEKHGKTTTAHATTATSNEATAAVVTAEQRQVLDIAANMHEVATVGRQQVAQPGAYSGGGDQTRLERNTTLDYDLVGVNNETGARPHPPPMVTHSNSTPTSYHSGRVPDSELAVANPVMDNQEGPADLMHANPVDLEAAAQRDHDHKRQQKKLVVVLLMWALLLAGIVIGFVSAGNKDKDSEAITETNAPTTFGSMTPSDVPSSAPSVVLDVLLDNLPISTLASINNGSHTPQWKAWNWLNNHDNVTFLPEWRKEQLFAMATVFYSMHGESWFKPIRERWMNYEEDECFWFSNGFGVFLADDIFYPFPPDISVYIPPCNQLGRLSSLNLLQLGVQGFKPSLPMEITTLSDLSSILLGGNGFKMKLSEFLPSQLYQLPKLVDINLATNFLEGTLPAELGTLTKLTRLKLNGNLITGPIVTELGALTSVRSLELDVNLLTGSLPSQFWLMTSLDYLRIPDNQLTGTLPSSIEQLSLLFWVSLYRNQLSGLLPSEMGILASLETLYLEENLFSGSLPSEIGRLTKLVYVELNDNMMSGTLPISQLQSNTELDLLSLGANFFSGSIPTELGRFESLTWLDLSNLSLLTGPIPSELGLLTALEVLKLGGCSLTGTIPTEVGLMKALKSFELQSNYLTGMLPSQLNESMGLSLYGNQFTGTVPSHLCSTLWCDCSTNVTLASNCFDLTANSLDWPGRFPPSVAQEVEHDLIMFNMMETTDDEYSWLWQQEANMTDVWETLHDSQVKPDILNSFLLPVFPNTTYKLVIWRSDEFVGSTLFHQGWTTLTSSNGTVLYSLPQGTRFTEISIVVSMKMDGSLAVTPTVLCDSPLSVFCS